MDFGKRMRRKAAEAAQRTPPPAPDPVSELEQTRADVEEARADVEEARAREASALAAAEWEPKLRELRKSK